ncbi:MAG: RidA family protein, partial [Proteobacteria bacterium]|nr:RidA family protein [Pseudomonadota bacterium]
MLIAHNPPSVAAPAALYVHGMEAPANARWLYISGQVGVAADGRVGRDATEQAEFVWANIVAILKSAGMGVTDIVKLGSYVIDRAHLPALRAVRERVLAGHKPASTLMIVAGLAQPHWLLEVEAYAAKA